MLIGWAQAWTRLWSSAKQWLFGPERSSKVHRPRPSTAAFSDQPIDRARCDECAGWWEYDDPFSDLDPSLLTAEQIKNYARVTGLLFPFDEKLLKGATYEVGIAGNAYTWDKKKSRKIVSVSKNGLNGIVLEPNSITFVETDVEFRLPQYLAIRFNLHIKLVHRGLLLGTGPIVDPGFRGRLLIPLHNLTSSPYTISQGEKIIWVEFTKTLFGQRSGQPGYRSEPTDFRVFPDNKRWLGADEYLAKANSGNPIMSSIAGFIAKTTKRVNRARAFVYGFGTLGLIGVVVSVGGAIIGSLSVYNNAVSIIRADEARRVQLEARLKRLEECLAVESFDAGENAAAPRC